MAMLHTLRYLCVCFAFSQSACLFLSQDLAAFISVQTERVSYNCVFNKVVVVSPCCRSANFTALLEASIDIYLLLMNLYYVLSSFQLCAEMNERYEQLARCPSHDWLNSSWCSLGIVVSAFRAAESMRSWDQQILSSFADWGHRSGYICHRMLMEVKQAFKIK